MTAIIDVPVLLIVWRRPWLVKKLISSLRVSSPRKVYVASDGANPDSSNDIALVDAVRLIVRDEIDWKCDLRRRYSSFNQGCCDGPRNAISWFFENVDQGIILEEDCVPVPDFVSFSANLLSRYRHDQRVWCISGNCYLRSDFCPGSSYYFSRYTMTWGWATWRDRWQQYDPELLQWPAFRDSGLMQQVFEDPYEAAYWAEIFERTYRHEEPITWWDYQWFFAALSRGALTAVPRCNLVSNIGFGPDATHTLNPDTPIRPALPLGQIHHPQFVVRHRDADTYTYAHHYGGIRRRRLRTLQSRIARRLSMAMAWLGLK